MLPHHMGATKPTLLLLCLALHAPAQTAPGFSALYAFGDSLTDTDSIAALFPRYYDWQFSNGPLWVEQLSPRLGFAYSSANNRAIAGTTTAGALSQVNSFSAPANAGTALFALWSGGNDFLNNLGQGTNETSWSNLIVTAVQNLSNALVRLHARGARTVLVPNLPDIGRTPRLRNGYTPAFQDYVSAKSRQFNAALAATLDHLRQSTPGLQLVGLDVFTKMAFTITNLATYGFTVATIGALDDPALTDKSFSGPGRNYVFWDSIHPSSKAHGLIANWAFEVLDSAPGVTLACRRSGPTLEVTCQRLETARSYTLQVSTRLPDWSDAGSFIATNASMTLSLPLASEGATLYRVKYY